MFFRRTKGVNHTSISNAVHVDKYFWPVFKVERGLYLLSWESSKPLDHMKAATLTEIESFCNHTHITDIFDISRELTWVSKEGAIEYDLKHLEYQHLCKIGKRMAFFWALKLRMDFPAERFRVYFYAGDEPIVRFHKVRPNEDFWLDEAQVSEDILSGRVVIFDTENPTEYE
jgi:hypothetical protein